MRIMCSKRYIHIKRDIWKGDPKIHRIKKNYSKYSYKFETLVTFKALPLWLDSAISAPLPLPETLPKTFNGNAVKGHQLFSLNLRNVKKTPPFWLKIKRWLYPHPPLLARPRSSRLFFVPRMNQNLKGRCLLDIAEVQEELLAALHNISVKDCRHCFQQWVRRWDRCIQSQGDYFEWD